MAKASLQVLRNKTIIIQPPKIKQKAPPCGEFFVFVRNAETKEESEKRIVFQTERFVTFASMGVEFALQTARNLLKRKKGMIIMISKNVH